MNCRAVGKRLVAYQDHELAPAELARVQEHLGECGHCRDLEARLAAATPQPFLEYDASGLWKRLDEDLDRAWSAPAPAPIPLHRRIAALLTTETAVPTPALLAYALLLVGVLGWGVHSWSTAQRLQVALEQTRAIAADSVPATTTIAGDPVDIPASDFRPAAYLPDESEAP